MKRKISIEYNILSEDGTTRFDPVEIPVTGYDEGYWEDVMNNYPEETPNYVYYDYGVHREPGKPDVPVTFYRAFILTDKPTQYWMDQLNTYDEADSRKFIPNQSLTEANFKL